MKRLFTAIALCLMCAIVSVSCSNNKSGEQDNSNDTIVSVNDTIVNDTLVCDSIKDDTVVVDLPIVK